MNNLFENYKNLSLKERIKFDIQYNKFINEENIKSSSKRNELIDDLKNIIDENGQNYFSSEFIEKLKQTK
mgnify:CR=1 FL=1|jgi:hypothetical protein